MQNSEPSIMPVTPSVETAVPQSVSPQEATPSASTLNSAATTHSTVPIHSFDQSPRQPSNQTMNMSSTKGNMNSHNTKLFLFLAVVVVIAGVATGAGISKLKKNPTGEDGSTSSDQPLQQVAGSTIKNGDVFGSPKESDFKDNATGYLVAGGVSGDGTFHLLRDGGPTQTVALNSSVTDLSKFENMQVEVWGETNTGLKAAWLMDVGRVKVINTQAQPPFQEQTGK